MKPRQFLVQFFFFALIFAAVLFGGIHQIALFDDNQMLSVLGFILFSVYTTLIYFLGVRTAESEHKQLFTQIHLGSIFLKMLLTIVLLIVYRKFYEPDSAYYILPFILVYVVFTVFETYVMMKISKGSSKD